MAEFLKPGSSSISCLLVTSFLVQTCLINHTQAEWRNLYGHSETTTSILSIPRDPICPVLVNDQTSTSFPWTWPPKCIEIVLPPISPSSSSDSQVRNPQRNETRETFCVYTSSHFAHGRGISMITTPEVATSYVMESFSSAFQDDAAYLDSLPYEIRKTADRGLGLFARRKIPAGEEIMEKHPTVLIHRALISNDLLKERIALLDVAVQQLPEQSSRQYWALAKSRGGDVLDDVLGTNGKGVRVGEGLGWEKSGSQGMGWTGESHLAVVAEAARVNHACRSNAFYRFDDYNLQLSVFATKDIKPEEEITFSYGFSKDLRETRRAALKENWGFTCMCALCSANQMAITASNARIQEIADMKQVLPSDPKAIPQLIALLPELIKLLEDEDLVTDLPMYEEILAYAWSTMGIEKRALRWASRARRGWEILAGKDSWEVKRTRELEINTKNHPTWATWDQDPWDDNAWEEDDHGHGEGGHEHEHDHEE